MLQALVVFCIQLRTIYLGSTLVRYEVPRVQDGRKTQENPLAPMLQPGAPILS